MTTLLHSALAVDAVGETSDAWLLFDGDTIAATGSGENRPDADTLIDLSGTTITPGFLDLHCHGGGGEDYATGDLPTALAAHRAHGTTRSLVSLVSEPLDVLCAQLAGVAAFVTTDPLVLGSHLEGPFLAASKRGAHAEHTLRLPDPRVVDDILAAAAGTLRQVTVAPELPGALAVIEQFVAAGVVVAIGHTETDAFTARMAFDAGATLITHAFNAMPGIHHRSPGPLVAAFDDQRVRLELVLDGRHVDLSVARIAFALAPGRIALVTDAMAAAGAPDGNYHLGSLDVLVREGVATVAGLDTIAGSTLTQDTALRMARMGLDLSVPDAVAAVTATPAAVLGIGDRFGLIAPGYAADVVVFDDGLVSGVWAAGARLS